MGLFSKSPPKVCPKCGKADGWRVLTSEPVSYTGSSAAVNPFSPAPIRNSFGQNLTGMTGKSKRLLYHCDNCGYEKRY